MNKLLKNDALTKYYLIYKTLLSEHEQEIYEMYYFDDYSINEIANIYSISKNAIFKSLQKIEKKLLYWEEQLLLYDKGQYLNNQLQTKKIDLETLLKDYQKGWQDEK